MEQFSAVLKRANKKAAKLSVGGFTSQTLSERTAVILRVTFAEDSSVRHVYVTPAEAERVYAVHGITHERIGAEVIYTVEVTGTDPMVDGYTFVATIDHEPGESNIVFAVPGQSVVTVSEWLTAAPSCGHCHLARNRNKTYLLNGESGIIQLGSTCLQDFFPGKSGEAMAALADLYACFATAAGDEDEWGESYGGSGASGWLREDTVTQACAVVREVGFVSKSKAEEWNRPSTASEVTYAFTWRPSRHEPIRPFQTTDDDATQADAVLAWVDSLTPDASDDYLWNLTAACSRSVVTGRTIGLVVSAVSAYNREQTRQAERAIQVANGTPVVEGRIQITGTVISTCVRETDYGLTLKAVVLDDRGFKVWGTVPSSNDEWIAGDKVAFTATVERSDKDEMFGFYKRPTKASKLVAA
jgi:hypothetical protein